MTSAVVVDPGPFGDGEREFAEGDMVPCPGCPQQHPAKRVSRSRYYSSDDMIVECNGLAWFVGRAKEGR